MRVLVTGGAGFIGSHVVERLLADGEEVLVVDDLSTGRRGNLPAETQLEAVPLRSAIENGIVERFAPAAVVHLAAQVDAARSVAEPEADARLNILDSLALFDACARVGVRRLVFASSAAVYGDPATLPCREADPLRPINPYGIGKRAVEEYLGFYRGNRGLSTVSLRFANVYGPRQSSTGEAGVVAVFASRMLVGRATVLHGGGRQTRDFIHVADVAAAVALALASETSGTFNVGSGIETEIRRIHAVLAAILAPHRAPSDGPPRAGDPLRSALDSSAAARELGWRAIVGIDRGLASTAQWFRERGTRRAD